MLTFDLNKHYNINQKKKAHRTTEEEMEGPISFWGYKEQESNLILPEHDDDDDDDESAWLDRSVRIFSPGSVLETGHRGLIFSNVTKQAKPSADFTQSSKM